MGLATYRVMLLGGVAIVAGLSANIALAQNVNTSHVTLLERLVIGAGSQKVAIDTPQAVTIVDQEDLEKKQAATLGESIGDLPGVTSIGSDRVLGESFNIRGIGSLGASDESKVIINVDGTPKFYEQYRMGSFFSDMELYKQVEVLRGPASSTLYGSGAIGGVINLTTKDASDFIKEGKTGAFRVKGTYDSNGTGRSVSGVAAMRASDNLEFLATGNYRASDQISSADGVLISGSDFSSFSGLLKGTAYLDASHEKIARLSYERWQSDAKNQDYSQTGTLAMFGKTDRLTTNQTATLSYEDAASDNPWIDLDVAFSFSDMAVQQTGATGMGSQLFEDSDYSYRAYQLKAENTIEHSGADFENYLTVGLQASRQDRIASTATTGSVGFHPEGVDNKLGLYVQNEFIWDERLTLIGGLRADIVNREPSGSIAGATTVNDIAWSPKIAALYEFNDNLSVFGSIAHTERLPTLDELFSTSGTRGASLGLEKETSNNYEFGAALSAFDLFEGGDTASLKATAFYNDLDNLISTNSRTAAVGSPYYVNVNKARIYGLEVEGAYNSEYVFGSIGFSMIYGENATTGVELSSIPAHQLVATLGGRLPEYDLEFGWKSTFAAAATSGTASDAYNIHGLFASWKPQSGAFEGLEARVSVENIFDAEYQNNLAGDKGKARTFKLSLSKQFDY